MIVALDRQHYGKPAPNDKDRGCAGNGVVEADWTPDLIARVRGLLDVLGHGVAMLPSKTPQTYGSRHAVAIARKAKLYVACHVNSAGKVPAGWTGYVLVEYVDLNMAAFARTLAAETGKALDRPYKTKRIGAQDRGYECIDGVAKIGVIYEPFFVQDRALARDDATAGKCAKALAIAIRRVYGAA